MNVNNHEQYPRTVDGKREVTPRLRELIEQEEDMRDQTHGQCANLFGQQH